MNRSVQPAWCRALPIQQQSVLFLAARGPDGIAKAHPCKDVVRAYRGTVLVAARYGRPLEWGQDSVGDDFMDLSLFSNDAMWPRIVADFFRNHDDLPHHYLMHLMHGAQIIGYNHPDQRIGLRWMEFYIAMVKDLHLRPESKEDMDARLSDWGRREWVEMIPAPLPLGLINPDVEEARLEAERLTEVLHGHFLHPDYEYETTKNGRKDGMNCPPAGDGWEVNVAYRGGFERFDYVEENYWRRRKAPELTSRDSVGTMGLSENMMVTGDG